ncbi:MAG: FAD-dependent oxidoreductase [Aquabacterium sp.]
MTDTARRHWLATSASWAACAALGGAGGLVACRDHAPATLPPDLAGGWVGAHVDRGHAWRDGDADGARGHARLKGATLDAGAARRVHTLIVGAGVAGLSAARVLMQAGLQDIAVLDLEDQPGGNARGHVLHGHPCPLGAHYLPIPGPDAREVAQWLEELGVIRQAHGRWVGDERYLCHSPQERVFIPTAAGPSAQGWWPGQWHEGLLPEDAMTAGDEAQFRRFAAQLANIAKTLRFAMPTMRATWQPGHAALDGQTMAQWLDAQGFDSVPLRWYLDYACRDDYGAGLGQVSAWAGLHYFASRHGHEASHDFEPVLTWPEGNAWLTKQLAQGLGERWHAGEMATRIDDGLHEVTVQTWSAGTKQARRWIARQVILCVPLFVARRLLTRPLAPLDAIVPKMVHAPWLVSNVLLDGPLPDRTGAPLSWDNVAYTRQGPGDMAPWPSLGYVNARHQALPMPTGPALITHYWALGGQQVAQGRAMRQALLKDGWQTWAARVAADLARIHPEWPARVRRMDLMRWGHAMSVPVPGLRGHPALTALAEPRGRLHFAHSDLSAYSVFEEAFTHGVRAAHQVLDASGMPRRIT